MSWWNYRGDAKNLFGGNPASNGRTSTPLPSDLLNLIDGWTNGLEKAKTYSQVCDICKVAFPALDKVKQLDFSNIGELAKFKCLYFELEEYVKKCKDFDGYNLIFGQETTKVVMKTLYKLSHMVDELQITECLISTEHPYALYGMMASNSDYYKGYSAKEVMTVCLKLLKEYGGQPCSIDYNLAFNFPVALETLLLVFKTIGYGHHQKLSKRLWFIIGLNLELPVPRVRELLLMLFQHLITDKTYFEHTVLPQLVNEWPWTNRNKYNMLALVMAKYKFLVLQKYGYKNLEPDVFMRGLTVSLRYPDLMPSSQALVRVLAKENVPQLYERVTDILTNRSFDEEYQNLVKFWLPHLDASKLFQMMNLDVDQLMDGEVVAKTVVFRNVFAEQLEARDAERLAQNVAVTIIPNTEQHLLEICVKNHIKAIASRENATILVGLFKEMADKETLHDFMLEKIASILKNKASKPDFYESVRSELVESELSKDPNVAAPFRLEFAIRVYDLLGKTTNWDDRFHDQLLKIQLRPSNFSCRVQKSSINLLMEALKSPLHSTTKQQKTKLFFETCKQMLTGTATEAYLAAPRFTRLLIQLEMQSADVKSKKHENLNMFFRHLWTMMENNYNLDEQRKDPLQTYCGDKRHLAGYVACLSEFLSQKDFDLAKIKFDILEKINDLMLAYLSSGPPVRPSDEDTDEKLNELVNRSTFVSDLDRTVLKQSVMASISYTIQALAIFFEMFSKRMLDSPPTAKVNESLNKVFTSFVKIFTSCSHAPTLEAVGRHFGGFVEALTKKRADYIRIPGQLQFVFNWEMTASCIIAVTVKNESASRFRSVRGFSAFMSELLANDANEQQNLLKTFLVFLAPLKLDNDAEFASQLGEDNAAYKAAVEKVKQRKIEEKQKQIPKEKGQKPGSKSDSDSSGSDESFDDDVEEDDDDYTKIPSDWESFTSLEAKSIKLTPIDVVNKDTDLDDKLWDLKQNKRAEHLKASFEGIGTFQLNLIVKLLEHPKMYQRPVMHEQAYNLLEFTLCKYFWGTDAEQELCLRIYVLLLTYLTRQPSTVAASSEPYRPSKVSIVELMFNFDIHFILENIRPRPTSAIYALALNFFAQFDYRNSIVRITDQKRRQGMSWVPQTNSICTGLFSAQKSPDANYDMYVTKMDFLNDPELRRLYAKYQSQIVLPEQMLESIQSGLGALVGELFVETPNEKRIFFEAEFIANLIGRAVVHCDQIYIYNVGDFYEELRMIVKEKGEKHAVSKVSPEVRSKMLNLLVKIGFKEDDLLVKQLLDA